jgi:hypothetical protein
MAMPISCILALHTTVFATALARAKAGSKSAMSKAMMEMTTSNSTIVKPEELLLRDLENCTHFIADTSKGYLTVQNTQN